MPLWFHRQQKAYWCGPACIQMLLGSISQGVLAKKLLTNAKTGTSRKAMVRVLRMSGKRIAVETHPSLEKLSRHTPALVSYLEVEGESHYAIVLRVTKSQVVMHDPWHGPNYALSRRAFVQRWKNPKLHRKYTGWMVTVG